MKLHGLSLVILAFSLMLLPILIIPSMGVSAATGTGVVTTTCTFPSALAGSSRCEQGPYYSNGYYYIFLHNATTSKIAYVYSSDRMNWTTALFASDSTLSIYNSVCMDDYGVFHMEYSTSSTYYQYARAVVGVDGKLTITITSTQIKKDAIAGIMVSGNHAWIMNINNTGGTHVVVERNSNDVNSSSWSASAGFPITVYNGGSNTRCIMSKNISGGMFFTLNDGTAKVYVRSASSTGGMTSLETASKYNIVVNQYISAVSDSSFNLYISYSVAGNNSVQIIKRYHSNNTYVEENVLQSPPSGRVVSICYALSEDKVYLTYNGVPTANHFYYKTWKPGNLSNAVDWINETIEGGIAGSTKQITALPQNGYMFMVYVTKAASPYNIKAAFLEIVLPSVPVEPPIHGPVNCQATIKIDGLTVTLHDTSTTTMGHISTYYWLFSDGTESHERDVTHIFASAGTYTVEHKVTDSYWRTGTISYKVTVPSGSSSVIDDGLGQTVASYISMIAIAGIVICGAGIFIIRGPSRIKIMVLGVFMIAFAVIVGGWV